MILGRRTTDSATPEVVDEAAPAPRPAEAAKGRPTPKRSASQKTRRTATPTNRKEAAAQQREQSREARRLARQALITGDERHLPPRDAGPERRLVRDLVDSRFTLGQVFFLVIFAAFAVSLIQSRVVNFVSSLVALLALTAMVVDSARHGRRAKLAVAEKFGEAEVRGISSYAFMRAFLPRRFRRPPPKVKRGDVVTY